MKGREKGYKKSHYMYSHFSCVIRAVEHNKSIFAFTEDKLRVSYYFHISIIIVATFLGIKDKIR
jgi:hypothetical protein